MNKFLEKLSKSGVLVSDGATGTNLQKAGLPNGVTPETWVMEQPQKIIDLEHAFIEAGSDIILTCTFGGTPLRMKESPYHDQAADLNRKAVELARTAADGYPDVLIAGSMGPVGSLIKPYGPLSTDVVYEAYHTQAAALIGAGVDFLVIETQFSLDEAKAAVNAAKNTGDLPIVISFSYDRGLRTMMGVRPSQVVETFIPMGVAAIGANCGTTLENMELIIKEYASLLNGTPIWAKPNAGMPELNDDGSTIFNVTPEEIGKAAIRLVAAGAKIVGGCCGNSPEHIANISHKLKSLKN
ncbi:MAG: homocysteine S-methyltransferase family protein [Anaerolineales bacterium]